MNSTEISKITNKTVIVGAITNAVLAVTKIIAGWFGNSHALIADGIHSTSDLLTDLVVYLAAKFGLREADEEHPYGHRRIETIATTVISASLILVAGGIIYDATQALYDKELMSGIKLAVIISVFSVIANEWLYRYTAKKADILRSDLLMANAWHHRSDAASSVVVLIGVIGTAAGFIYLDAIAAIVVGIMIIKMAVSLGWFSIKELVDTTIEPSLLEDISKVISEVDGVVSLHQLRGRYMASDIVLDVHVMVEPYITVSEGHFISQKVRLAVTESFQEVKDMTVHIDPEDDEMHAPTVNLAYRKIVLDMLEQLDSKNKLKSVVEKYNLHYLDGKIDIEIIIKENNNLSKEDFDNYTKVIEELDFVRNVKFMHITY